MMNDDTRRRARLNGKLTFPESELIQELETMKSQGMSKIALKILVARHFAIHKGFSIEGQEKISYILNS